MPKIKYQIVKQEIDGKQGQFIVQKNGADEEYFGYGGFMKQRNNLTTVAKKIFHREIEKVPEQTLRLSFTFGDLEAQVDSGKQLDLENGK